MYLQRFFLRRCWFVSVTFPVIPTYVVLKPTTSNNRPFPVTHFHTSPHLSTLILQVECPFLQSSMWRSPINPLRGNSRKPSCFSLKINSFFLLCIHIIFYMLLFYAHIDSMFSSLRDRAKAVCSSFWSPSQESVFDIYYSFNLRWINEYLLCKHSSLCSVSQELELFWFHQFAPLLSDTDIVSLINEWIVGVSSVGLYSLFSSLPVSL